MIRPTALGRDAWHVGALVAQLHALDVDLAPEVVTGCDQLERIDSFLPSPRPRLPLLGLSDEELAGVVRDVGVAYALDPTSTPGSHSVRAVKEALAEALADRLLLHADEILDQLRPRFDEAGKRVHEATLLGIHPWTTDRDVVKADDVEATADAWTALPQLTGTLDRIAAARIALTRATGCPPAPPRGDWAQYAINDQLGGIPVSAMFRDDAPGWRSDSETTWQMWVRLCTGRPVRLLSTEAAVAAVKEGVPA